MVVRNSGGRGGERGEAGGMMYRLCCGISVTEGDDWL